MPSPNITPSAYDFGHALWLTPANDEKSRLERAIHELSRQHGGTRFVPHITLRAGFASELEARRHAFEIASACGPLDLTFAALRTGDAPFEALTLELVDPEPLQRVDRRLGARAQPYRPHLSLFYGMPSEALVRDAERLLPLPMTLHIAAVEVWRLQGPIAQWSVLAREPLRST